MHREYIDTGEDLVVESSSVTTEELVKQSRIFTALGRHFNKYDDLLKNSPTQMGIISSPNREDL